jgi:outer membrane lipoprotein SlyB
MKKSKYWMTNVWAGSILALTMTSCATNTQTGALAGGVGGAVIGGAIWGWPGALIGGAVGAGGGALIGSAIDENGKKQNITPALLVYWKNEEGRTEAQIKQKLIQSKAELKNLNPSQEQYLKENGFSSNFIYWYQNNASLSY